MNMNNKAISPVIAAILMIIVVVALVIILYGFSVGLLGGATTASTEASTGMTGSTSTGFIEGIDTNSDNVYLRSSNDIGATLDAVYVGGTKYACSDVTLDAASGSKATMSTSDCSGLVIEPNQTVVVTGNNNFRATSKS
ncbi:MAG: hypothetical protein GOV15_02975 [Candidatus Diapherotrites archaeon]|nr:hypothetical protein [Candidatus Diapherotrites archaeon]